MDGGFHRWPVDSPRKGPVTLKAFPYDDVIVNITMAWAMRLEAGFLSGPLWCVALTHWRWCQRFKGREFASRIWQHKLAHYYNVIMSTMASQVTSLTITYSSVCSGAGKKTHQISASLAFVRGIHRWPANSLRKGPVTRKMFPFDGVFMLWDRGLYGIPCVCPYLILENGIQPIQNWDQWLR